MTQKSIQVPLPLFCVTIGGSPPGKKLVGLVQVLGWVGSAAVENDGGPVW